MHERLHKNMKKMVKAAALSLACLVTTSVSANQVGLSVKLADESARIGMLSETEWMQEIYRFEAGFQYNENKDYLVDTSILYTNKGTFDPNLDVGFRAKAALATLDRMDETTYGVMLGIYARYWLPTPVPSALVAEYLNSPQIITFGDGNSMEEYSLRGQIQLLRNLNGFVGYRYFSIKNDAPDYDLEDGWHVGIELSF